MDVLVVRAERHDPLAVVDVDATNAVLGVVVHVQVIEVDLVGPNALGLRRDEIPGDMEAVGERDVVVGGIGWIVGRAIDAVVARLGPNGRQDGRSIRRVPGRGPFLIHLDRVRN